MLCQKSSTIGALLLTLSSVNAALTYWIDPNCPSDISRSIDEAKEGASRILNRWNNPVQGDTYLPFLRKTIWRDGPDTEISYNLLVPKILGRLKPDQLTQVGDDGKAGSDVRFYCDDDNRWEPLGNDPNPNAPQNSDKGTDRPYIDKENSIKRQFNTLACKQGAGQLAGSYFVSTENVLPIPKEQKRKRMTVSLCKKLLEKPIWTYQDLIEKVPPNLLQFSTVDLVVTTTIVHELMHSQQINTFQTSDSHNVNGNTVSGYQWEGIQLLDSGSDQLSMKNPDSWAWYVAMGRFWDNQWQASQNAQDVTHGKFIKDPNIPVVPYPPQTAGTAKVQRGLQPRKPLPRKLMIGASSS